MSSTLSTIARVRSRSTSKRLSARLRSLTSMNDPIYPSTSPSSPTTREPEISTSNSEPSARLPRSVRTEARPTARSPSATRAASVSAQNSNALCPTACEVEASPNMSSSARFAKTTMPPGSTIAMPARDEATASRSVSRIDVVPSSASCSRACRSARQLHQSAISDPSRNSSMSDTRRPFCSSTASSGTTPSGAARATMATSTVLAPIVIAAARRPRSAAARTTAIVNTGTVGAANPPTISGTPAPIRAKTRGECRPRAWRRANPATARARTRRGAAGRKTS